MKLYFSRRVYSNVIFLKLTPPPPPASTPSPKKEQTLSMIGLRFKLQTADFILFHEKPHSF